MITQIDFYILNAIQNMRNGPMDIIMPLITYLGSGGALWIAWALLMFFGKKSRKCGVAMGIALLAGYLLSTIFFKEIIARERPFNTEGALLNADDLLIGVPSGYFSFPSGHSLSSFSAAYVLLYYHRKNGIAALVIAALIAFSRLYLYVHFPTDVIGGAVIAIGFAALAIFLTNKIWENRRENSY